MSEDNLEKGYDFGEVFMEWSFPEYNRQKRDKRLLFIIGVLFAGLVIYSIATFNFLFLVILLLTAFIIVIREFQDPMEIRITFTEKGLFLGDKFIPYIDLKNFSILYDPPDIKSLYFVQKSKIKSELSIDLADQNPVEVRKMLLNFVQEDLNREEEPASDVISRILKF